MNTMDYVHKNKGIFLMLGSACNMKCKYCFQQTMPRIKKEISPKVFTFIQDRINNRPKESKYIIHFFGGEPLLYWDNIVKVVNYFNSSCKYIITTNGKNLTKDKIEFFNKNKIHVNISNDGEFTEKTGRENILLNSTIIDLINQIEDKSIETVLHAYNLNIEKTIEWVNKKIPNTPILFDIFHVFNDTPLDLISWKKEELNYLLEELPKKFMEVYKNNKTTTLSNFYIRYMDNYFNLQENPEKIYDISCNVLGSFINIDCQGNIYACHNSGIKLTTVDESFDNILNIIKKYYLTDRLSYLKQKGCLDCEVYSLCLGDCPLEYSNKNLQSKACIVKKALYGSVLNVFKLTEKFLNETSK